MTLPELARLAGLSPFHLCRVFRQSAGMTPPAYQTHRRVRQAKALLRAGLPIASAAIAAGFYDQATSPGASSASSACHPAATWPS